MTYLNSPRERIRARAEGNRYVEKPQELSSLIYFCKQNNFKATLVTTIDISDNKTIDEINITYVPSAVYAYNIGVNTLELKSNW